MRRRLQTWGLALILGLALSAALDGGRPLGNNPAFALAQVVRAPGR